MKETPPKTCPFKVKTFEECKQKHATITHEDDIINNVVEVNININCICVFAIINICNEIFK